MAEIQFNKYLFYVRDCYSEKNILAWRKEVVEGVDG